jgi:signal transduction histidine kinase
MPKDDQEGARILVVDDEPNITDLIATALRFQGFEVKTAGSGREHRGPPRQVAANLVSNALQHAPESTPVRVTVSVWGGEAVLEVADQGPGLTPEQAAKVFDRFFRVDEGRARSDGGAGLGLSIVSAIVKAHGGRVGSRPSRGRAPGSSWLSRTRRRQIHRFLSGDAHLKPRVSCWNQSSQLGKGNHF